MEMGAMVESQFQEMRSDLPKAATGIYKGVFELFLLYRIDFREDGPPAFMDSRQARVPDGSF